MEVGRVGIAFEQLVEATPLRPILLLHLSKVSELSFPVISEGPTIVIQPCSISLEIQTLDLVHNLPLEITVLLP